MKKKKNELYPIEQFIKKYNEYKAQLSILRIEINITDSGIEGIDYSSIPTGHTNKISNITENMALSDIKERIILKEIHDLEMKVIKIESLLNALSYNERIVIQKNVIEDIKIPKFIYTEKFQLGEYQAGVIKRNALKKMKEILEKTDKIIKTNEKPTETLATSVL